MQPVSVTDFTSDYTGSNAERHYRTCPVCQSDDWKVYLNMRTGKWFCFAHEHSSGGKVELEGWTDNASAEILNLLQESVDPVHVWAEVDLPRWRPLSQPAARYLQGRGIGARLSHQLSIVEDANTPRIIVPYFGSGGRIVGWTARAYSVALSHEPKYLNPVGAKPPFVLPHWGEKFNGAILVEGAFDAIAVWHATGLPTIAIGGSTVSARMHEDICSLVQGDLIIMLDDDALPHALRLAETFMGTHGYRIIEVKEGADPGSMSATEIVRAMSNG